MALRHALAAPPGSQLENSTMNPDFHGKTASPASPPHWPLVSLMLPVVLPLYWPGPGISLGERQLACLTMQKGLLAQSVSWQSIFPSLSSSVPLLQSSGLGAQLGAKALYLRTGARSALPRACTSRSGHRPPSA